MTPADWFRNARVRNKILAGYSILILLFLVLLGVVFGWMAATQRASAEMERLQEAEAAVERVGFALTERIADFREFMISGAETAIEKERDARLRFEAAMEEARRQVRDPGQAAMLDSVVVHVSAWEADVYNPGVELRRAVTDGDAPIEQVLVFFLEGEGARGADRARTAVREFRTRQAEIHRTVQDQSLRTMATVRWIVLILVLLAVGMSIWAAYTIANRIVRPLERAVAFAGTVAERDLTGQLEVDAGDEVGEMVGTLNRMSGDLRESIRQVSAASAQVASAAEEIAATSEEISNSVDEQVISTEEASSSIEQIAAQINRVSTSAESLAASVDETSSSIAQISASIEQTAERVDSLGAAVEQTSTSIEQMGTSVTEVGRHVRETEAISKEAEQDARDGGKAVQRSTTGMERIHAEMGDLMAVVRQLGATSEAISAISEVIEDIADQTNLLALNASIEAARAGEHGRGFSVVAQEIRRLAERSVESTREIGSTIGGVRSEIDRVVSSAGGVMARTEEGIDLAGDAAEALHKIVASVARTRELMEEVGSATEQQTEAADQAKNAITDIMRIAEETRIATREQAISSRQISEAVENMNQQTQEVFEATAEQRAGGEIILQATDTISSGARSSQSAIQEMVSAAEDLSEQANRLSALVQEFRTEQ